MNMDFPQQRSHIDLLELFDQAKATEHGFLRVSAPMVRYSKLEFRKLLRKNGVDLCFTPMIVADSFNNSQKARENEFTTCLDDCPLVAQFAAKDAGEFVTAAQLIYPYVDGIDLNCGCPQSWAIGKGYGVGLLRKPEIIRDIVQSVRRTLPQNFSISLKIRLLSGGDTAAKTTVEFARQLEKCGITFLTIHGRTMWERTSAPLNVSAIAEVKQSIQIPIIANGDVRSWADAMHLYNRTQADGIMSARGLLSNPSLFSRTNFIKNQLQTPHECIQQWINIATRAGEHIHFQCLHHHLTFMCGVGLIKRRDRFIFNNLTTKLEVFDFLKQHFGLVPSIKALETPFEYINCTYEHFSPSNDKSLRSHVSDPGEWNEKSDGKFFEEFNEKSITTKDDNEDFDLEGSFFTELAYA